MAKSRGKVRRRIDRRDWTQYNRWQSDEVRLACQFLKALVESSTIHDWEGTGAARESLGENSCSASSSGRTST